MDGRKSIKMELELLKALQAKAKAEGYRSLLAYLRALVGHR